MFFFLLGILQVRTEISGNYSEIIEATILWSKRNCDYLRQSNWVYIDRFFAIH